MLYINNAWAVLIACTRCQLQMKNNDDACLGGQGDAPNHWGALLLLCVAFHSSKMLCAHVLHFLVLSVHFLLHLDICCRRFKRFHGGLHFCLYPVKIAAA